MSPHCLGIPLHCTVALRLGRPKKSLKARWFGQTVEAVHRENTEVGAFSVTLRAPRSTLLSQDSNSLGAWCLIEPQAVNPREENQLIQIKDSQTGNGIVKSNPWPAGYLLKIGLITRKPNMLTWNEHQMDRRGFCRAVRRFWHNLTRMTQQLFVCFPLNWGSKSGKD